MADSKRAPDTFAHEGPGGAYHRNAARSKADWADAYAERYKHVLSEASLPEDIVNDGELRDDVRRLRVGERVARMPKSATDEEKA